MRNPDWSDNPWDPRDRERGRQTAEHDRDWNRDRDRREWRSRTYDRPAERDVRSADHPEHQNEEGIVDRVKHWWDRNVAHPDDERSRPPNDEYFRESEQRRYVAPDQREYEMRNRSQHETQFRNQPQFDRQRDEPRSQRREDAHPDDAHPMYTSGWGSESFGVPAPPAGGNRANVWPAPAARSERARHEDSHQQERFRHEHSRPESYRQETMHESHAGKGPRNWKRSDARIEEDVNEELTRNPRVDATEINVSVKDGEVTLSGFVRTRDERREAAECAWNARGVRDVHSQIRVSSELNTTRSQVLSGDTR